MGWLPPGKIGAVCLSVDDVHPGRARDGYDGGGDLGEGALGRLEELLAAFPRLRATLFVTPDWRPLSVVPTRRLLARIPGARDLFHLAPARPRGAMALPRHPAFTSYLRSLPRTDLALHGLHHLHRGLRLTVEFQRQSRARCAAMLRRGRELFAAADLDLTPGLQPPGWELPAALLAAMADEGLRFVVSARDLVTPVSQSARTASSGLRGVSLIHPQVVGEHSIVHLPVNFQATSAHRRAFEILDAGGVVSVKAHVAGDLLGYRMRDGLDARYAAHLASLFEEIERRYGEAVWWASMAHVAERAAGATSVAEETGRR